MGRKLVLFLLLGMGVVNARGAHLVGGDLSFVCQGNNLYDFTLTVYRDAANPNGTTHDNTSYLFVYNLDNNLLFSSHASPTNPSSPIMVTNNDLGPCLQNPDPPNLDFKIFRFDDISLPVNGRGYRVVYQRCCRSADLQNLANNFDGFSQGSSYEIIINLETMNQCNQPSVVPELVFNELPPTQWCANQIVAVDQSVDGGIFPFVDSVVYSLCAPFDGGSGSNCIIPTPVALGGQGNCNDFGAQCEEPCSYNQVTYDFGYNELNPMGNGSSISINPQTGNLIVDPNSVGIFAVAICATAWKNGVEYSTVSRDFSFKVFDCVVDGAGPPEAVNGSPLNGMFIDSIGQINDVYLVCSDSTVEFSHNSGNQAINFYWDFGVNGIDSDTSLAEFPSYTYSDTGTYLITFVVNRNEVCVDTAYSVVRVLPILDVAFLADVGCFTLPVEFMDTSVSTLTNNQAIIWDWDFGDGTTSSGDPNPSHTFGASQNYTVQLVLETALGCHDSTSINVFPEPSPEAGIGNLLTCTSASHVFDNLSNLNGTALDTYSWDFDDDNGFSFTSSNAQPPLQIYADSGYYDIQLAVSSFNGCSDTTTVQLLVVDQVFADFSYNPPSICPGQEVQFTNTTAEYFDSILWNINGESFTIENPVYTYQTPGIKTVDLTLYSNGICGGNTSQMIPVEIGPFADFDVDSTCTGSNFTFINHSLENGITIDSFLWDYGDGNSGVGFEPTYVYQDVGDFTVTMIAMTNLACKDTTTRIIPVKEGIETDFVFGPDTICEGVVSALFTNLTTGGPWDNVLWEFGDTNTLTGEDPTHLYLEGGFYDVTMTVYDDICGENETNKTIEILHIPQPVLPDTLNICDGIIERLTVDDNGNYLVWWSTGDTLTNTITIDNSPDSVIVFVDNRGCRNTDMMYVTRDCPAYLPNTFTPNGDGVNDLFMPLKLNITSFTLSIYSRWGEMVYSSSSFDGWDGMHKGKNAPIDTYVYNFSGIGLDEKPLHQIGTISILR